MFGLFALFGDGSRLTIHVLFGPALDPVRERDGSVVFLMCMEVCVSWISYPLSQNWPKDRRDLFWRSGKRCTFLTATGKCGMLMSAVCVAVIFCPSGCITLIPCLHCLTCVTGALTHM